MKWNWDEIHTRYKDSIVYELKKYIKDSDDIADLTQNTFAKAYLAKDSYQEQYKLGGWLSTIARNEALDFIKQQKRHRHVKLDNDDAFEIEENGLNGEELMISDELLSLIEQKLPKLKPSTYLPTKLKLVDKLKADEIATRLNMNLSTTKSYITQGRKQLFDLVSNT
jgi:RNA polymerase sigma-70 factor (ECF subfamily)